MKGNGQLKELVNALLDFVIFTLQCDYISIMLSSHCRCYEGPSTEAKR